MRQSCAKRPALLDLRGIGPDVELQVAGDRDRRRAQLPEAARIGLALRAHPGERGKGGSRQPPQEPIALRRLGGHARVGEHERHAVPCADVHQVGPDLRFHQHAEPRPVVLEEALHGARIVVGQPGAKHRFAVDLLDGFAARRGEARQQDVVVGVLPLQRVHERRTGARLAHRHRVHPEELGLHLEVARAEALCDGLAIPRLAAPAPPQPRQDVGQRSPEERGVQDPPHQGSPASGARSAVASANAACTATASAPSRLRTRASACRPVRRACVLV